MQFALGTSIVSFLMPINACLTLLNVKHVRYRIDNDSFAIRAGNFNSYVSDEDPRLFDAFYVKHVRYRIDNDSFAIRAGKFNSFVSDADQRLFDAFYSKTREISHR